MQPNWTEFIGLIAMIAVIIFILDHRWRNTCADAIEHTRDETREACKIATASQISALAEQSKGFYAMKEDVDLITLYLRGHYKNEIDQGFHQSRSLGKIVTGYLGRERQAWARSAPLPPFEPDRVPLVAEESNGN